MFLIFLVLQEFREEEEEEEDIDSLVSFHRKAMASSSSSLSSSKVKLLTFSTFPALSSLKKKHIMVLRMKPALNYLKKIIYNLRASSGKLGKALKGLQCGIKCFYSYQSPGGEANIISHGPSGCRWM